MIARPFRAPAWAWLLVLSAAALFATLGTWQLGRGLAKARLATDAADTTTPVVALTSASAAPPAMTLVRATVTGRYEPERQLLQQGQSRAQQPGQHVWTPFALRDGARVLVNRGWVPADAKGEPPPPAGEVTLHGFWRTLPEPGLRLGDDLADCPAQKVFPHAVLYPTAASIACLLGRPALPGLFLLGASEPGGFVREWGDTGLPPERHYGYAFQWYALAVAAIVVFVVVNRSRP